MKSIYKKSLRVTYHERNLYFGELLNLDKSVFIHYKIIKYLLTETYKVKLDLPPPILAIS